MVFCKAGRTGARSTPASSSRVINYYIRTRALSRSFVSFSFLLLIYIVIYYFQSHNHSFITTRLAHSISILHPFKESEECRNLLSCPNTLRYVSFLFIFLLCFLSLSRLKTKVKRNQMQITTVRKITVRIFLLIDSSFSIGEEEDKKRETKFEEDSNSFV